VLRLVARTARARTCCCWSVPACSGCLLLLCTAAGLRRAAQARAAQARAAQG